MWGYSVEEHVDNMNDGEENHNCAQSQIEDTGEIAVYKFLKKELLKITNVRERIEFQRLQRSEKPKSGSSRPILSRFLRYGDNFLLLSPPKTKQKSHITTTLLISLSSVTRG